MSGQPSPWFGHCRDCRAWRGDEDSIGRRQCVRHAATLDPHTDGGVWPWVKPASGCFEFLQKRRGGVQAKPNRNG